MRMIAAKRLRLSKNEMRVDGPKSFFMLERSVLDFNIFY